MVYQVSFFDHADRTFARDRFEAEHDDAAIAYACRRYRIGKGFHLHRGECRLHTEIHGEIARLPRPAGNC